MKKKKKASKIWKTWWWSVGWGGEVAGGKRRKRSSEVKNGGFGAGNKRLKMMKNFWNFDFPSLFIFPLKKHSQIYQL